MKIQSDFFTGRPTEQIAQDLLGVTLIKHDEQGDLGGVIVETEAYLGDQDTTAHAFNHRKTRANAALFGRPGTLYFYTMRGLILMNLICQSDGIPQGVLLRAIEPTTGIDLMKAYRDKDGIGLTNGPAKMTAAMGVNNLMWNNIGLADSPFELIQDKQHIPQKIAHSARVGVSEGDWHDRELRFYVNGNPFVSGMRKRDIDGKRYGWRE